MSYELLVSILSTSSVLDRAIKYLLTLYHLQTAPQVGILLPRYGKKLMGDSMNALTCATPPEHAGKNLISLTHRHLRCLDMYGARPERDATILIGVLIGLLLALPVCLTVFILWRRGFFFCGSQGPASFSRAFYKRASNDDQFWATHYRRLNLVDRKREISLKKTDVNSTARENYENVFVLKLTPRLLYWLQVRIIWFARLY